MPGDSVGELDSDMRDLARLFDVSERPQGVATAEVMDERTGESEPRQRAP